MFLQILSCAFLTHLISKQYYPNEYKKILLLLTEKLIFAYSFVELKANKVYRQIRSEPSINSLVEKMQSSNDVDVIDNNRIIFTSDKKSIYSKLPFSNSFIIFSEREPTTSNTNRILIHNFSDKTDISCFNYKKCKYMFISIDVLIKNQYKECNYHLSLFYHGDNYFIVNNKIDKYVIYFLLYHQQNICYDVENSTYKLTIIDQFANLVTLNDSDIIMLYEDNYEIVQVIGNSFECKSSEDSENSVSSSNYEVLENEENEN
jgi:hypothetical protein